MPRSVCCLFVAIICGTVGDRVQAQTAAQLFPDTAVAYLEISEPAELWEQVAHHAITQQFLASEMYLEATRHPGLRGLMTGLATLGFALQQDWQAALQDLSRGGIYLAADESTGGLLVLVRSRDAETLERFRRVVTKLLRDDAARKGEPEPARSSEYRGIPVVRLASWHAAFCSDWLLLTNQPEAGKELIDRYLDRPAGGFAEQSRFQAAAAHYPDESQLRGYVDLVGLRQWVQRQVGDEHPLVTGRAPDPGAELIWGGVLGLIHLADHAAIAAHVDADSFHLTATVPHVESQVPEERQYFFRAPGDGAGPITLDLPGMVAAVSMHRDVARMWLHSGDLFGPDVNDQMAAADGTLTTLFSGRDFGEDILGAFRPDWQLVIVRQSDSGDQPQPAIRLPAFALVTQLREPEQMQRDLRRIFLNLVGFLNIVGAMNGQPQLDLSIEPLVGGLLVSATYDQPEPQQDALPIQYNFSPSLAFARDYAILASTSKLAGEIGEMLQQPAGEAGPVSPDRPNTRVLLELPRLAEVLSDNRGPLIAQNMLEKGHRRDEAEREIDRLLGLLGWVRRAELRLDVGSLAHLTLRFDLSVTPREAEQDE